MIEKAYSLYYDELLAYAKQHIEANLAEDMVQQAFIDLMALTEVINSHAFLYRSIIMNIRDYYRKEIGHELKLRQMQERGQEKNPEAEAIYNETMTIVKEVIASLPMKHLGVIEDVICNGLSCPEAAYKHQVCVKDAQNAANRAKPLIKSRLNV